MRIAVAGASGRIGRLTTAALTAAGHETVKLSRSAGIDLVADAADAVAALEAALRGVEAVVDVTSVEALDAGEVIAFFTAATSHLLAAEQQAGVRHHVALSIVNVDGVPGNAHYAGKIAQERLVADGPVPWTIVRATQFHDFPEMIVSWTERDGTAMVPPLLLQPIAPADVAAVLAEVATGAPAGRLRDLAGPDPQDLVDMARRTLAAGGRDVRLVPTWSGVFGEAMAGNALLPGADARIAPTSFEDWLATR